MMGKLTPQKRVTNSKLTSTHQRLRIAGSLVGLARICFREFQIYELVEPVDNAHSAWDNKWQSRIGYTQLRELRDPIVFDVFTNRG